MYEVISADEIKTLMKPLLEKGFLFEYFYQKGGDSSCVYICRFKKGKDFVDWREVSGGTEINIVASVNGEYRFPSLKLLYSKEYRKFKLQHLFKKPTVTERRAFVAKLLIAELNSGKPDFFGIKL